MRILIVSDIHANLTALDTVVRDAEQDGAIDAVWSLGDNVGYGPPPAECCVPVRALYSVLRHARQTLSYPLAVWLGSLFLSFARKRRETSLRGLRRAFPEKDDAELLRIAKRAAGNFCRVFVDVARIASTRKLDRIVESIDMAPLREIVDKAARIAPGKPVIFCTPHLGSWEVGVAALGHVSKEVHLIGRQFRNPFLDRLVFGSRTRFGQYVHPKKGGIRPVAQALEQGKSAGFASDQNQRRGKLFVPFFGELASADRGPASLARLGPYPIVIGTFCRIGGGFRFDSRMVDVFLPDPDSFDDKQRFLEACTLRIHESFESLIRSCPEQYLGMHDRWRTRPKPSPEALDGEARSRA